MNNFQHTRSAYCKNDLCLGLSVVPRQSGEEGQDKRRIGSGHTWLTGFEKRSLQQLMAEKVTFETFFQHASSKSECTLITGVICGYRVEEIENSLTQQVRYLDKLVDELAKGRKMEKILRGL